LAYAEKSRQVHYHNVRIKILREKTDRSSVEQPSVFILYCRSSALAEPQVNFIFQHLISKIIAIRGESGISRKVLKTKDLYVSLLYICASPLHYQSPHSTASKTKITFRNTAFMPFLKAIFLISSQDKQSIHNALFRHE
jgi:hypothetical protein